MTKLFTLAVGITEKMVGTIPFLNGISTQIFGWKLLVNESAAILPWPNGNNTSPAKNTASLALNGQPDNNLMPTPESLARKTIDQKLTAAGWIVQDFKALNLGAGPGVAVREFQTASAGRILPLK